MKYIVKVWVKGSEMEFDTKAKRDDAFKKIKTYMDSFNAVGGGYRMLKITTRELYDSDGKQVTTDRVITEDTETEGK